MVNLISLCDESLCNLNACHDLFFRALDLFFGTLRAQLVKCWHADLVGQGSIPTGGRNCFDCNQGSIAYSLILSPTHCPDMTETLLKRLLLYMLH